MNRLFCWLYVRVTHFAVRHSSLACFLFGFVLLNFGLISISSAAEGGDIFREYACKLYSDVLEHNFGAMITVVTGALAIIASIVGSFKGAWALLFVSVGCFIAKTLVQVLFPGMECTG